MANLPSHTKTGQRPHESPHGLGGGLSCSLSLFPAFSRRWLTFEANVHLTLNVLSRAQNCDDAHSFGAEGGPWGVGRTVC